MRGSVGSALLFSGLTNRRPTPHSHTATQIRSGDPAPDTSDEARPYWQGVIPVGQVCFPAVATRDSDAFDPTLATELPQHIRAFARLPPVQKHPFMVAAQASGAVPLFESRRRFGPRDLALWLLYVFGVFVALTIFNAVSSGSSGSSEL